MPGDHDRQQDQQALTTVQRDEDVSKFAQVIAAAFANDTLNRYMFLGRESRPDHPKLSQTDLRVAFWQPLMASRFEKGGILVQTYDWAGVALWWVTGLVLVVPLPLPPFHWGNNAWSQMSRLPPGVGKPNPSDSAAGGSGENPVPEGAAEYREKFDALKQKYLGGRPHWYLNLIGRLPSRREEKGAIRGLIEPFLQKACEENLPVWLEATNRHAKEVYSYFGFRVAEEVRIGKGVVNAEGWVQADGEGVLLWGMVAGL
ncbi:uncharacterized protein Z518_06603 [Rhinocladiella mackenziei CBS 650.93]|uniref:N-acetyltransferase domain-containing protein n=1 Tax=Rhinocladiella mackenziei CBS 650.93 TaxID=1442369 RepID=A0A0D2GXZ7_9EURO|nr:uncharacterized protein Z518_06603 [Rhinocladiella mackenziei CBS 650.93]KIX03053.1 hypothetical protein Z518_06603 [Rhinocladiella mackenziei CBS 650.93]